VAVLEQHVARDCNPATIASVVNAGGVSKVLQIAGNIVVSADITVFPQADPPGLDTTVLISKCGSSIYKVSENVRVLVHMSAL